MKRLTWPAILFSLSFFAFFPSCTGGGGCSQIEPPPATIPPSQVVENGLQVRITEDGFNTIKTILPQFVEGEFGHLAFIPEFWVGSSDRQYGIDFCAMGCGVDISRVDMQFTVKDNTQNSNNIEQCREGILSPSACDEIWVDLSANIYLGFDIDVYFAGMNITNQCQVAIGFYNKAFEGTIALGLRTRPSDGQLRMDINSITDIELGGLGISLENCIPILEDFLNALILENIGQYVEMVQAFVGNAIVEFIANQVIIPLLQPTIDKLFPDPMGLEGQINVGQFLADAGFLGNDSRMELKLVSGGFVDIKNRGITAGVITGFNSDVNPSTRAESKNEFNVAQHSEGARCVPPIATFDFAQYGLSLVTGVPAASADRLKTFTRRIIQEFSGSFDQAYLKFGDNTPADVGIALTQDFLNLLGFHLINSGALCLTVGSEQNAMLKVGTFSVLIPSLAELIDPSVGDAPLQLVIRPQTAMQFSIGQGSGTETPLLDVLLQDFQIDVYPFVNGRYARALTLALDMHLEIDLEEGVDPETNNVTVMPVLRPVDASKISARVINADLIRENPEDVAAIFPSILGMLMPMIGSALQPIPMPTYEITKLNSQGQYLVWRVVRLSHLEFKPTTASDAALIIAKLVSVLPGQKRSTPPHAFTASLKKAVTYAPERLRATLAGRDNARPEIVIDLQSADGAPGEYQYSLDGGAFTPFMRTDRLVIRDLPLFLQGRHTVKIRGRRAGVPESLNLEPVVIEAILDTLPPKILPYVSEGRFYPHAVDYVSDSTKVEVSFYTETGTFTPFERVESIPLALAKAFATSGELVLRARDEAGNVTQAAVDLNELLAVPVAPQKEKSTFLCTAAAGGRTQGTWALWMVLGAALWMVRHRRHGRGRQMGCSFFLLSMVATIFLLSACADGSGKKNNDMPSCFWNDDCAGLSCPSGEIPLCLDGQCACVNDIPWGIPGPYATFTLIGQFAWVAAYNPTYGDLMVTTVIPSENDEPVRIRPEDWFFVDGVPSGPVVLPDSDVRGGINAKGPDVGSYPSIATLSAGTPIIAHHNATLGALRITYTQDATEVGAVSWTHYELDDGGDPYGPENGDAGYFNKIHIRAADSAPGVAYMVNNIPTGSKLQAEVRFAQARVALPTSPSDWDFFTVDTLEYALPGVDAPLPDWPEGQLFIALDRFADGRAAIAWYDPYAGALKFSHQTEPGGAFAQARVVAGGVQGELPKGLFAAMTLDPQDANLVHFAYQDGLQRSLWYATLNLESGETVHQLVDDGFRVDDGPNQAGLPMPVQHYFGSDVHIRVAGPKVFMAWQDATTQELYFGVLDRSAQEPAWDIRVLRGNEDPYDGSVGFYIDMKIQGSKIYLSTYGVNLHAQTDILGNPPLRYYVEIFAINTGVIGK